MPFVDRVASSRGTPRDPKISTSALCHRISESSNKPSISKSVARKLTTQPLHTSKYRVSMTVRISHLSDVDSIVSRVQRRLVRDATIHPLLNPSFSADVFSDALSYALNQIWVDERG